MLTLLLVAVAATSGLMTVCAGIAYQEDVAHRRMYAWIAVALVTITIVCSFAAGRVP